ncbi:MAG: DUF362 domain-containing protein [Chloroflexi bacterium]|nr:DUF362 domain-containing protein [Chloroflexota bacterium]
MKSRVALVRGDDRLANVRRALELLGDDVAVAGKQRILVKPNFVSTVKPLAATHVDAVRGTLAALRDRGAGRVTVGEGPALGSARAGFDLYGYLPLADEFGVTFHDLNGDDGVPIQIYDRNLRPISIRLSRTAVESDYRVSVTPLKTHDAAVITAGLKNMLMGSPLNPGAASRGPMSNVFQRLERIVPPRLRSVQSIERVLPGMARRIVGSDKVAIHQGYPVVNLNLLLLAKVVRPHLSVIDAFVAMEGAGPTGGTPVEMRLAIASADPIAADALAAYLAGFEPRQIGYLRYCAEAGMGTIDLAEMAIAGEDPERCRRPLLPHPHFREQLQWQRAEIDRLLGRTATGIG